MREFNDEMMRKIITVVGRTVVVYIYSEEGNKRKKTGTMRTSTVVMVDIYLLNARHI